jgi:hypothetical protein
MISVSPVALRLLPGVTTASNSERWSFSPTNQRARQHSVLFTG